MKQNLKLKVSKKVKYGLIINGGGCNYSSSGGICRMGDGMYHGY